MQGEDSTTTTAGSEDGEKRSLQHKKSFASSIASLDMTTGKDSPKGDRRHKTEEKDTQRKSSNRFLSGFKDALHKGTRRPSSSNEAKSRDSLDKNERDVVGHKDHARHHQHSKEESYDSITQRRPKRTSSFNDAASAKMSSLSSRTIEDEKSQTHPSSMLHLEPRGETDNKGLKDHTVKWERTIDVGVRIPVVKNRVTDKGSNSAQMATASGALSPSSNSAAGGNSNESSSNNAPGTRNSMSSGISDHRHRSLADSTKSGDGDSKSDKLDKDVKEKDKDRDMADSWGMLSNTDFKVTIRGEISTERNRTKDSDSHVTMGYVSINLAELAPYPESSNHQHHHNHHHHHHGIHLHHHHGQPSLSRVDTRRYLLVDSRNNATLKVTIEMTHIGGTREYSVPAARTGLVVSGAAALIHTLASKGSDSGTHSEASHSTEGHNEHPRPGMGDHKYSGHPNDSMSSFTADPISNWPSDSVAKHGRIPSSNLKTELSHQDAARAVKEAGGQRMGFSFGAGAHHERPPEDVIDSLFSISPSKTLSSKRSEKFKASLSSSPAKKESKAEKEKDSPEEQPHQQANKKQIERGVFPEKPAHFDGLSPAEHPRDSAQSRGEPLSRLPSDPGSPDCQPGPDIGQTHQSISQRLTTDNSSQNTKSDSLHRRTSSNGTVKSILTNSMTPRSSLAKSNVNASNMERTNSSGPSSNDATGDTVNQKSSQSSNTSGGTRTTNLVHWDSNIVGEDKKADDVKQEVEIPPSSSLAIPGDLDIPVTNSPRPMSRDVSEDSLFATRPRKSSLKRLPSLDVEEEEEDEGPKYSFAPPDEPPNAHLKQQKEEIAQDNNSDASQRLQNNTSRRTKGLTKEEALKMGYRGAGWGTMARLWPYSMTDSSDLSFDVHTEAALSRSADPVQ
jgi:hypothetical protein